MVSYLTVYIDAEVKGLCGIILVYIDAEVKGLCGIILDCVYRC